MVHVAYPTVETYKVKLQDHRKYHVEDPIILNEEEQDFDYNVLSWISLDDETAEWWGEIYPEYIKLTNDLGEIESHPSICPSIFYRLPC